MVSDFFSEFVFFVYWFSIGVTNTYSTMSIDKSWIDWGNRCTPAYFAKLDEFLDYAYANKDVGSSIYCPCRVCKNRPFCGRAVVREHLQENGFWVKYKMWTKHGEMIGQFEEPVQMEEVLPGSDGYMDVEMIRLVQGAVGENGDGESMGANLGATESTMHFLKLMQGANQPLYPGSKKHTALSFAVRILQAKSLHGWTDTSFKELLEIFNETMPEGVNLPRSYYEAEKLVDDLGFTFQTVDACPNSCMLFRKEDADLDQCVICNASRWRERGGGSESGRRRAAKQARYFPLKPRLQRLFATTNSATLMKWHGEKREDDGVFRHPADCLAWKDFDITHPSFAADIRNVRLGIASDGFNPFGTQTLNHSTWPIVLVPYNLPPMYILKQPYIYLSVLIDGPKGPGDKIDVYMQPLIEELKELWEDGVETFDASTNQMFQMRAALLWSINDFPAYANLSGWSTKGEYGCPNCNTSPGSRWLKHGRKWCYGRSRRFLPYDHRYRKDRKSFFDKKVEYGGPPPRMNGVEHLSQLHSNGVLTQYKREDMVIRHKQGPEKVAKDPANRKKHNWKKKSIFYDLPYWEHNLLQHSIDPMHCEKNVAENVMWTIMGVKGRTKDNMASRRELADMEIRKEYHVKERESGAEYYERAEFEMDNEGKDKFLLGLSESRMPDGSCSSIARRVNLKDRTICGLKSHDFHILLQQLIPLCVRSSLPKNVVSGLIELGTFFKILCSKVNTAAVLEEARSRIIVTLCDLEKIFPPSFFDVMEHLPIHLVEEALIGGAVQFRWMYPIERFLLTLKNYVRQHACPEASIAKGYLMEECMSFCSQYLKDVESKSNRPPRRKSDDHKKGKPFILPEVTRAQIHRWVLFHTKAVTPYLK